MDDRAKRYGETFRALHGSTVINRLWAQAMGDEYPAEVEPFSSCSWWLLGELVAALRLRPGAMLVDLGCGRGGPGLWLARALSARLVGVDFSADAVALASSRAPSFVADGRARFVVGTFAATGLRTGSADTVVSVDALPFAPDRDVALCEVRRILAPGGRLAFSAADDAAAPPDEHWPARLARAGFEVRRHIVNHNAKQQWYDLYDLWQAHTGELRRELGDVVAARLLEEASNRQRLATREPALYVASPPG